MKAPLKELKVNVEPVQDLHGYDHPWPAGGGKNLLRVTADDGDPHSGMMFTTNPDGTIKVVGTSAGNAFTFGTATLPAGTYTFSHGTNLAGFYLNIQGVANSSTTGGDFTLSEDKTVTVRLYTPASGTAVNGYLEPMIRLSTSPAGYAPYKNECPIEGWTGVNIPVTGKNLYDLSKQTKTHDNTYLGIYLKPGEYIFSLDSTVTGMYVAYSDEDELPPVAVSQNWTGLTLIYNAKVLKFTAPKHKWFRLMTYETNGVVDHVYQLELNSEATAYEPYQSQTYEVTFPSEAGTVYGGSLTVNEDGSGALTVDRASVDLGTLSDSGDTGWKYITNDGTPYFRVYLIGKRLGLNMICSVYETSQTTGTSSLTDKKIGASANDIRVYLRDSAYTDLNTFISAMSGVQLVYELATPLTYTLTAAQVTTLLGTNNVWSDAGDVELSYWTHTP